MKPRRESLLPDPIPVEDLGRTPKQEKSRRSQHLPKLRLVIVCISLPLLALFGLILSLTAPVPHVRIQITPQYRDLRQTITITAVTGKPTPNQLAAQVISAGTQQQTTTALSTGTQHYPAQQAQGNITFYNANTFVVMIHAGVILDANGVQIVTLAPAAVPAVIINGTERTMGQTTVSAQAVQTGPGGNIAAKTLYASPCCADGIIAQNNQAFSGGQDAITYTIVQQHDIDAAAAPVVQQEKQTATSALVAKVQAPDHLVDASLACTPTIQANPPVGSRAEKTSLTIAVSCQAETYNSDQASQLASTQFVTAHLQQLGTSYMLVGHTTLGALQVSVQDTSTGTLALARAVSGRFLYRIDQQALKRLLPRLAGMHASDAQALLRRQPGVDAIAIVGLSGDTFPADAQHIDITVQPPRAAR